MERSHPPSASDAPPVSYLFRDSANLFQGSPAQRLRNRPDGAGARAVVAAAGRRDSQSGQTVQMAGQVHVKICVLVVTIARARRAPRLLEWRSALQPIQVRAEFSGPGGGLGLTHNGGGAFWCEVVSLPARVVVASETMGQAWPKTS